VGLPESFDQTLRVWDAQSGRELRQLAGHTDAIVGVAISPDGRYILSGSLDRTARLWNLATGQEVWRFVGHTGTIGLAGYVYILANGEVTGFVGHTGTTGLAGAIAFTPDGRRMLTAGTARLWDVEIADTVADICACPQCDFTPEERAQYGIPDDGPTCARRAGC